MKTVLVCTVALLLPFAATAGESSKFDRAYQACLDQSGPINNGVVHECSGQVSDQARAAINRHYGLMHTRLRMESAEDANKLEASQKAWIAYRNQHCELATTYIGSPMSGYCPMKLNSARALELEELSGE